MGREDRLIEAAGRGDVEEVKALLAAGADAKTLESCALRSAAWSRHADCVRVLIPVSDREDFTEALQWAIGGGEIEVVKALLAAGADAREAHSCALRWATEHGRLEIINLLEYAIKQELESDLLAAKKLARDYGFTANDQETFTGLLANVLACFSNYKQLYEAAIGEGGKK